MSAKLKVKRGTTESWSKTDGSVDITLEAGQIGVEYCSDGTTRMKVGSNITANYSPTTAASINATKSGNIVSGTGLTLKVVEGCKYRIKVNETEYDYIAIKQDSMYTVGNYALKTDCTAEGDPFLSQGNTWYFKEAGTYTVQYKMIANKWSNLSYVTPDTGIYKDDGIHFNKSSDPVIYDTGSDVNIGNDFRDVVINGPISVAAAIKNKYSTTDSDDTNRLLIECKSNTGDNIENSSEIAFHLTSQDYTGIEDDQYIIMHTEAGVSGISMYPEDSSNSSLGNQTKPWAKAFVKNCSLIGAESGTVYATPPTTSMPTLGTLSFLPPTVKKATTAALPEYSAIIQKVNSPDSSETGQRDGMLFIGCEGQSSSSGSITGKGVAGIRMYTHKSSNLCSMYIEPSYTLIYGAMTTKTSYLGTSSNRWTGIFGDNIYASYLYSTNDTLYVVGNMIPRTTSTSSSSGYTLGSSNNKWRYLYAYSGTIQTSDRSAKDSIHYITNDNDQLMTLAADDTANSTENSNISEGITMEDVLDFVSTLNPATFCYKSGQEVATEDNSDPEEIQLGLIADDIKDHKLFKYVGVETEADVELTPAEVDDDGNEITPAVTEKQTTRGLQAIPLATAALTACKYLLNKVQELDARIYELESK